MRHISEKEVILGYTQSYWSWEYDTIIIEANLIMSVSDFKLRLNFTKTHIKTGLGAGRTSINFANYDVGTFFKPQLKLISSLLSKHKQTDRPFPRKGWHTDRSKYLKLHEMLEELRTKEETIVRSMKMNKIKQILKNKTR